MTEGRDIEIDDVGKKEVSPIDVDDGIASAGQKEHDEPLMTEGTYVEISVVGGRLTYGCLGSRVRSEPATAEEP